MPPKTKKLFISYRSTDAAKVDKIASDLALLKHNDGTACFTTWQDKRNLPPASPHWWDAIVDAIIDSDVFVFFVSSASLKSEVCRSELDYAHKRNRPIIPVVLDGEFHLNSASGKYDLGYWELVPDWLRDQQFLFYVGTQFFSSFLQAIESYERNWPRDIPAPRPLNPDSKGAYSSNHAQYDAACDYAERLVFAEAEKLFSALVRRNDPDYGEVAADWLELLRLYAELVDIDERPNARFLFMRRWSSYTALFPKDFIDGIFDPRELSSRSLSEGRAPSEPTPLNSSAPSPSRPNASPSNATARAVEGILSPTEPPKPKLLKPSSDHLLPAPFAWIDIPGNNGKKWPAAPYRIAKYPITNAQFKLFLDAGGYKEQQWWTEAGWKVQEDEKWTEPRYWRDPDWNSAEQPVVGVSWYEAIAFCLWLSEATGEQIMLPTEKQWQYAAQGDDGRDYPWGPKWDPSRCNNDVLGKGIRSTTPVRRYEGKGDSPFGVVDMAGNAWELCLTDYENGTNDVTGATTPRSTRGGSWEDNNTGDFRCVVRLGCDPRFGFDNLGYRISRS